MDRITKRLIIALVISAGLNLFFIGFSAGRRLHHGPRGFHEPPQRFGMELGPRGFLRRAGLGDAGPEVERILDAKRTALRGQRDAIDTARKQVADALSAEPFDAQRFTAALAQLQTHTTEMQTQMHGAFVEVAKTLSPAQRKQLARAPWFMHEPPPAPPR